MADEWHVSVDGAQRGPLTSEQVRSLVSSGRLKPTDHIWKDGMPDWVAASTVRGLFPQQQPVPQKRAGPPPLSPFPVVAQGAAAQSVSPRASPATFSEAATRGFSRLFDFNGRASRSEFWWFYLFVGLVVTVPSLVGAVLLATGAALSAVPTSSGDSPGTGSGIGALGIVGIAIIVLATLWIYSPAYHGDWLWDDDQAITQNPVAQGPWNFYKHWIWPDGAD